MASNIKRVQSFLAEIFNKRDLKALKRQLTSTTSEIPAEHISSGKSAEHLQHRLQQIQINPEYKSQFADDWSVNNATKFDRNIENYIGTCRVPLGLAGPVRVNGLFAKGDYLLPLATTEAALVASYSRGCKAITLSGGCTSMLTNLGVSRSPGFIFNTLVEAGEFVAWATNQFETFAKVVSTTTRYGSLIDVKFTMEGNHVYIIFDYATGDASGQNMVTIATQAIVNYIVENSPVMAKHYYVEANLSGDKKASQQSFQSVRGKKVISEVNIPKEIFETVFHTTPKAMADYWRISCIGGVLSSTIGCQGHYANGLAALYIATGQDAACVSESSIGLTRMEETDNGDLYASVTLPNIMVGTIGGGTGLPTQNACLEMMGLSGLNKANALAEVCGALCLGGELSIMAALTNGDFTKAHQSMARKSAN